MLYAYYPDGVIMSDQGDAYLIDLIKIPKYGKRIIQSKKHCPI